MSEVVQIEGLVKSFGRAKALDGLDLSVSAGQIHGFLGPNGAGKSTTIRILLGLMRADAGEAAVLGRDPWSDAAQLHAQLAYVPGDVTLWPSLTGGEVIDLLGRMRGSADAGRRDELIERFQLDPGKRCRTYSTGNRQKVALVAALCADAELLILDEPTSGLDPLMEEVFRACVREAAAEGRTVLLSSHILSEVEALCDQVTIIRDGRVVERGSLADLRHLSRTSVHGVLIGDPAALGALPEIHDLQIDGAHVRFEVDAGRLDPVLARLAAIGTSRLVVEPASLEELFLRHYDRSAGKNLEEVR
ncbi:ABC transporter ATP-binding protein [Saccharopolyspora indica]|uniref:ABC transporter ATP-binding protein n=1 Tax=Saccharopolyspora indica TaxID=1229659 RepID=UPI0022EB3D7A|nr:ABC transporter ATP-binding protein [Saccharopolyspora indica]MDA3643947.1 ABC transporter ATP-binding protein [Saccharopolyspora indica]